MYSILEFRVSYLKIFLFPIISETKKLFMTTHQDLTSNIVPNKAEADTANSLDGLKPNTEIPTLKQLVDVFRFASRLWKTGKANLGKCEYEVISKQTAQGVDYLICKGREALKAIPGYRKAGYKELLVTMPSSRDAVRYAYTSRHSRVDGPSDICPGSIGLISYRLGVHKIAILDLLQGTVKPGKLAPGKTPGLELNRHTFEKYCMWRKLIMAAFLKIAEDAGMEKASYFANVVSKNEYPSTTLALKRALKDSPLEFNGY